MAMFDPVYVTEVLNDILSRKGLKLIMTPKGKPEVVERDYATACLELPQTETVGQKEHI